MNTNVTDAIKFMSNLHKEYSEEFDIKTFDKESLDTATRCVLEMLNYKSVSINLYSFKVKEK